jgi:hypothetical protein
MGKFKESFSSIYYNSKDDFFAAIESGDNEPTYVGLLEIVRVLKLMNRNKKNPEVATPIQPRRSESQLFFTDENFQPAVGVS